MFAVGIDIDARTYFSAVTQTIAIPTAVKIYTWADSLLRKLLSRTAIRWVQFFLIMFVVGGISGLLLANSELDVVLHDSYHVVAHFHYVLSLGALFGFLAGFAKLWPSLSGSRFAEQTSWVVSSIMAIGASIIFWPMHAIGLLGLPRRIADCSDCHAAALSLSTLGSVLSICSVSLLVFSLWDWWSSVHSSSGSSGLSSCLCWWVYVGSTDACSLVQVPIACCLPLASNELSFRDYCCAHTFIHSCCVLVVMAA